MERDGESDMVTGRVRKVNVTFLAPDDFVRINVCGTVYQPLKSTLAQFPTTLLGDEDRRRHYFVDFMNAYYFDRHRECFDAILYYYQSAGCLIRPNNIPMDQFTQEVRFFGISEDVLSNLQAMEGYVQSNDEVVEEELPKNYWQRKVWEFMEYPESSLPARIVALMSILVILLSLLIFCLETLPQFRTSEYETGKHKPVSTASKDLSINTTARPASPGNPQFTKAIGYIEILSIAWFTGEYIIRFLSSPNKWKFFKSFLNLIDLVAFLPYYIILAIKSKQGDALAIIRIARLMRVFRVFKLSRHSMGLQIMGSTLKASINELAMILAMMCFSVIVFSSAIYYAEHDGDQATFESIPSTFWYSLVTMTTVGYGDHVPLSFPGKCLGGMCAVAGVLMIAMVVPVIVTNFEFFYKRDRMGKINTAQKEQRKLSTKQSYTEQCETNLIN